MPPCADMSCAVAADSVAARSAARADARAIVTPGENHDTRTVVEPAALGGRETPVARASPRPTAEARGRDGENTRARDAARVGRAAGCGAASARRRRPRASRRTHNLGSDGSESEETSDIRGGEGLFRKQSGDFCAADAWFARIAAERLLPMKARHAFPRFFAVCAATVYPTVERNNCPYPRI